jgi:hypothetical protein
MGMTWPRVGRFDEWRAMAEGGAPALAAARCTPSRRGASSHHLSAAPHQYCDRVEGRR